MDATAWPDTDRYSFGPYRAALGTDWSSEDDLLARWLDRHGLGDRDRGWLDALGRAAATTYRSLADATDVPDGAPRLRDSGPAPTAHDVDLAPETERLLAEIHGGGLWDPGRADAARYAAVYLLAQNGEAGAMCSVACTDGLLRALRALGRDERSRDIVRRIEAATPAAWVHGAQFVTEIQGGSDAATNAVHAEPAGDGLYALHGQKWFCSNLTADYWLVTARPPGAPEGARDLGLFVVPRDWDGRANGHVVERLKEKLGTRALATAEIRLTGARAWPLGPLDQGLKNMVSLVLTTSRVHNTLACAALARRASREAHAYARFRTAFGRRLEEHPLVAERLAHLAAAADRTEAGAFATVDAWLRAHRAPADDADRRWARVLVSLAKAVTARRAVGLVYDAMMLLGGNGIEERFSALPRLWRDAAIFETWEGPYTLLLMQALEDLERLGVRGNADEFLRHGLGERARPEDAATLEEILSSPRKAEAILRWGHLAPTLYGRFEEASLAALRAPRAGAPTTRAGAPG